jgi:hypothetical protein
MTIVGNSDDETHDQHLTGSLSRSAELRARRFMAFADRQRLQRKWVRLSRLALHCAETRSPDGLETMAGLWISQSYSLLLADIRSGFFTASPQSKFSERGARLQLLYVHPSITPARMTIEWLALLQDIIGHDNWPTQIANTVGCCWTSWPVASAWCEAHDLPPLAEKRGPKVKDDALAIATATRYRADGYSLRQATEMAIADTPDLVGASKDAIFDRIRRKLAKLENNSQSDPN